MASWDLTARQLCDLELLATGGFSPLRGFMTRADYEGVCHDMRLASGALWPMPITLDVTEEFAKKLTPGTSKVALRDPEGVMLGVLHVEDVWQPDRKPKPRPSSPVPAPPIPAPITPSTRRIHGTLAEKSKARRSSALRFSQLTFDSSRSSGGVCSRGLAPRSGVPDA